MVRQQRGLVFRGGGGGVEGEQEAIAIKFWGIGMYNRMELR